MVDVVWVGQIEKRYGVVLQQQHAATALDGDLLGVDRGEHVLEGLADELQRLVVVGEVVEDDDGRVVIRRLHDRGEEIKRSCRRPWRRSSGGHGSACIPPPE